MIHQLLNPTVRPILDHFEVRMGTERRLVDNLMNLAIGEADIKRQKEHRDTRVNTLTKWCKLMDKTNILTEEQIK